VHDGTESGLALHDDVGDTHLAAQGWEEDDELDWIDVVSDDDEGCFLGFDKGNAMVKAVFNVKRLLRFLGCQNEAFGKLA
jgi:hypothetical protein